MEVSTRSHASFITLHHLSLSTGSMNAALWVDVDSTNPASVIVECTFEPDYTCTIDYGSDSSYTNLVYRDNSTTLEQVTTITLSKEVERDTIYYFIVSAESSSLCVRVRGTFRTGGCIIYIDMTRKGRGLSLGHQGISRIAVGIICLDSLYVSLKLSTQSTLCKPFTSC